MRIYFLAVAVLTSSLFSLARGDYLIIIANMGLNKGQTGESEKPVGMPGMNPADPMGAMPPGMMPAQPPQNAGPADPGGGMDPGGMAPGIMPGMPVPGGVPGPMVPGGGPMVPGAGPRIPGVPGIPGAVPGSPGGKAPAEPQFAPLLVVGVVEVRGVKSVPLGYGMSLLKITHKWGESFVVPATADKRIIAQLVKLPTVNQRYALRNKLVHKDSKPTPVGLLELAEWSLQHGLHKEFLKTMEELAEADKNHQAVVAFQKVQAAMARPISKPDSAEAWRKNLGESYKVVRRDHYTVLHNLQGDDPVEVKSRLDRLEANYRTFFWWFALKGKVLPVPDERLMAVLVLRQEEFERQHQMFDSMPLVADGFLARRENLAVFSLDRLDAASVALRKNTEAIFVKIDRDAVLKKFPKGIDMGKAVEVQTLALLHKALEEDSEIASVSHEGTRQLLAATGLLPRNVLAPQWIQFGVASVFETPKGSPWMSMGTAGSSLLMEFNHLARFQRADKANQLDKPPAALDKVITDQYFREADAAKQKKDDLRMKAQVTSWSLCFFLVRSKLDGLIRFHQELAKMPRDLELDSENLRLCFARAFDLLDPTKPNTVDPAKLARLASDWHAFIRLAKTEGEELSQEVARNRNELGK